MKKIIILFISASILYSCSSDNNTQSTGGGNNPAAYTQIDFDPVLSLNKDTIVYVNSNVKFEFTGLYSFDLLNGFNKQLFNGIVKTPDISPVNSKIVYSQDGQLTVIDPDGMNSQILNINVNCIYPKWNQAGTKILYENMDCLSGCGIRIINSDGSGDSLIISKGSSPEWTNGTDEFIYLLPQENGNGDSLYKFNMNSGVRTLLYIFDAPIYNTSRYLNFVNNNVIFCSTDQNGYTFVYKLILSTGVIEKLALNQGWSPYYSKTNAMIYYTNRDEGNGRIWIMDINGNGNRQYNEIY